MNNRVFRFPEWVNVIVRFLVLFLSLAAPRAFADRLPKERCEAIVRTPDGAPAGNAKVVVGSDNSTLWLINGEICEGRSDGLFLRTDNGGRLDFRPRSAE